MNHNLNSQKLNSCRFPELDGLRGVAIILVIIWHYFGAIAKGEPGSVLAILQRAVGLTWSGVDLFFVLSGFLIGRILMENVDSGSYFRTFYLRRICRIFPLYFGLIFLFGIAVFLGLKNHPEFSWLYLNPMPVWSYATFTQNFIMAYHQSLGANWLAVTWSLAVEEQFYLLLPLLIRFVSRERILYILIGCIFAAPICRVLSRGFPAEVLLVSRGDSLLIGVLAAYIIRNGNVVRHLKANAPFLQTIFFTLLAGVGLLTYKFTFFGALNQTWLALFYVLMILIALAHKDGWLASILRHPFLQRAGWISYGLYMFHQVINGLFHGLILGSAPRITNAAEVWTTLGALVATITVSWISFRWFEKPIIDFGHSFRYEPKSETIPVFKGEVSKAPIVLGEP